MNEVLAARQPVPTMRAEPAKPMSFLLIVQVGVSPMDTSAGNTSLGVFHPLERNERKSECRNAESESLGSRLHEQFF